MRIDRDILARGDAPDRAVSIDRDMLARVTGAAGAADFGRCGPGSSWRWLGDTFTPACAAHDEAVRGALAAGSSRAVAHIRALPLLPAAIGSYVAAQFD